MKSILPSSYGVRGTRRGYIHLYFGHKLWMWWVRYHFLCLIIAKTMLGQ